MSGRYSVLVLEDNESARAVILDVLRRIVRDHNVIITKHLFSTFEKARDFLSDVPGQTYDVIILDRNDANGESFHALPLEKLGVEKIISISSVPRANEEARARGVHRHVLKDYHDLESFGERVDLHIREILKV